MTMSEVVSKERFTSYLPVTLIEQLREVSEKTGIPQTRILERAVEEYLIKMEVQKKMFENL
jgi:predicted DNA-binding protein